MRVLEPHCEWTAADMRDAAVWTEVLTKPEQDEIDAALRTARAKSDDLLEIGAADFPLPRVGARIARIKHELVNGRGVVRLRGIDRARYDNDELCMIYWGVGAHLGNPWAQNAAGHVLGDVTDQGKAANDPTSRGNEIGGLALPFHCDGSFPTSNLTLMTRDRTRGPKVDLAHMIRMQSRDTAAALGLHDRGMVRLGLRADLNVIDYDRLRLHAPQVAYDLPAGGRRLIQRADGYEVTMVAGQVTYRDGVATDALPGRLLRGARPSPVASAPS